MATIGLAQLPAAVITNNSTNLTIAGTNMIAPLTVLPTVPASAIGSISTSNGPQSVAVAGRYAYVVDFGANTLQVLM